MFRCRQVSQAASSLAALLASAPPALAFCVWSRCRHSERRRRVRRWRCERQLEVRGQAIAGAPACTRRAASAVSALGLLSRVGSAAGAATAVRFLARRARRACRRSARPRRLRLVLLLRVGSAAGAATAVGAFSRGARSDCCRRAWSRRLRSGRPRRLRLGLLLRVGSAAVGSAPGAVPCCAPPTSTESAAPPLARARFHRSCAAQRCAPRLRGGARCRRGAQAVTHSARELVVAQRAPAAAQSARAKAARTLCVGRLCDVGPLRLRTVLYLQTWSR